jgi:subtilisin family serine protease
MNSRRIGTGLVVALAIPWLPLYAIHSGSAASPTQTSAPTRLVVKFRSGESALGVLGKGVRQSTALAEFKTTCSKYQIIGFALLDGEASARDRKSPLANVLIANIPSGVDPQAAASDLAALSPVEYAHPDWRAELYDVPNDSLYTEQWALNNTGQNYHEVLRRPGNFNDRLVVVNGSPDADIDAQEVLAQPPRDRTSVIVAIIDTGVDRDHPDLAGQMWTNAREIPDNNLDDDHNGYIDDYYGWDYCGSPTVIPPIPDNNPTDEYGHGTHCAGIIASAANNGIGIAGVVDSCRIMALKFYPVMLSSFAARAVVYAADNGADVISMSFGYPWPVQILEDALAYAHSKGVILCAGSGNSGDDARNYPAAYDDVIAVGATNSNDQVTSFSTYGSHIDLCGPGQSILSLRAQGTDMYGISPHDEPDIHIIDSLYYLASGTSMACPHAAGVAAYLRTMSPGLRPSVAEEIMRRSADDIIDPYGGGDYLPGWDKYSGYGRVNLQSAVAATPRSEARIDSPLPNQIVRGEVEIRGNAVGETTTFYTIEIGQGEQPAQWRQTTQSNEAVRGGLLGIWNSSDLEGRYTLRLKVDTANVAVMSFYVANSTIAGISSPASGDTARSSIIIEGSATAPGFSEYRVSYVSTSDSRRERVPIKTGTVPVVNGPLCVWSAGLLPDGWFEVYLAVYSDEGEVATDSQLVYVQSPFSSSRGWKTHVDGKISIVPNFGDFDRDGTNEIILGTSNNLIVLNTDGTKDTVWTDSILVPLMDILRHDVTGSPEFPGGFRLTSACSAGDTIFVIPDLRLPIAVGNLDGDRYDDFVGVGPKCLFGYSSRYSIFTIHLGLNPYMAGFDLGDEAYYPSVSLKDVDGDGVDEIHFYPYLQDSRSTRYIYKVDGTMLYGGPLPPGADNTFYAFVPADVDGDGIAELYAGNRVLYRIGLDGDIEDSFNMDSCFVSGFLIISLTGVDIDADGRLELIAYGNERDESGHFWVFAFDENLRLKEGWPHDTGISQFLSPSAPVFGDIDLDGSIEYFITAYELSQGEVFGWHVDGAPYLGDSLFALFGVTPYPSRLYSPILADVNGDGYPELVACAEPDIYASYPTERIVAWDRFGNVVMGWPIVTNPLASYTSERHTPVVGDVDGDGNLDLMMTTVNNDIVFMNIAGSPFDSTSSPVAFWHYNRRMNNIANQNHTITSVHDEESQSVPREFELYQNYPNPFNPATVIEYTLKRSAEVSVSIFDVLGRKVRSYRLGARPIGRNRLLWDGRDEDGVDVASGVYFYRIKTGIVSQTRKMVKLK